MLNTQTIKSLTDLRLDPAGVIKLAENLAEPVYIFNRSKPLSVIMAIDEYENLIDRLDDALDTVEIKKIKKSSKKSDFVSLKYVKKELGIS